MENRIGDKIKALRKSKGLTLKEIAEQTNLSISFLSQVERMKSSLTLESLKKISEVLEVNPSYFFSENDREEENSPVIRGIINEKDLSFNHFIYKDLSSNRSNLPFSPILVVLHPGENNGKPFSHNGVEFLFVLEGTLTVLVQDDEYELKPYDSTIINSKDLHYWLNKTEETVKFLCISSDLSR